MGADTSTIELLDDRRKLWALAAIVSALWLASTLWFGVVKVDEVPTDYVAFWAAGELAGDGAADQVYDVAAHHRQSEVITGPRLVNALPYLLPPSFLPVTVALATLGFFGGFALLSVLGVVGMGWVAWRIVADRLALALGFASPTTVANLQIGQLGLLTATAAAVALLDHERRPVRAGLALGVLSFKPQFGVGIGLALGVARAWKALGVGLGTSLALVGVSVVAFGSTRWSEFRTRIDETSALMDQLRTEAPFENEALQSTLVSVGLDSGLAWALHLVLAAALVGWVLLAVHRHGLTPRTMALTLIMTVLISPRALGYDQAMLVPAALWLVTDPDAARSPSTVRLGLVVAAALAALSLLGYAGGLAGLVLLWLAAPEPEPEPSPEPPTGDDPEPEATTTGP